MMVAAWNNGQLLLTLSILWSILKISRGGPFEVKREVPPSSRSGGEPPYASINYFTNKNKICWYKYCSDKGGRCKSTFRCCTCKCKDKRSFFSYAKGCQYAYQIKASTRRTGLYRCCVSKKPLCVYNK